MNPKSNSILVSGLLVAALASGCTTTRIPEYRATASSHAISRDHSGLQVTADPFFDKQRCAQFFHVSALADGIAILHLQVANHSPTETFLLTKEEFKFKLSGSDSATGANQGATRDSAAGEAVAITGAVIGSLPMALVGVKLLADATVVRHNFTSKEFRSQTLAPGETAEGFVYFQVPKTKAASLSGTFAFTFRQPQTQNQYTLELPISHAN